jgi:hypothetical protein
MLVKTLLSCRWLEPMSIAKLQNNRIFPSKIISKLVSPARMHRIDRLHLLCNYSAAVAV